MAIHYSHTARSLDSSRSKYDFYGGDDCMKQFGADLRKHATKTINYEENESYNNKNSPTSANR